VQNDKESEPGKDQSGGTRVAEEADSKEKAQGALAGKGCDPSGLVSRGRPITGQSCR
jgi:hypothetical protein